MNYNKFRDISCYEEFEIKSSLTGISKIDILRKIGNKIDDYYFFISNDGIFNWFDLYGNHVKNPGILKEIIEGYIPKNITKCIIPDSVIYIGEYSFYNCNSLKEITIPDSVTCIANHVFSFCESLTSVTLPNNITSIGHGSFWGCKSLTSITIPDSVTGIGYYTFYRCKSLTSITIPNTVTYIDELSFSYCKSLKEIIIPDSVKYIGDFMFYGCDSLKEVIFKGKALKEVKQMEKYPFGIADERIIKVSEI